MKHFALSLLSLIFILACSSDPCEDKTCGEFGTCDEGTCICEQFYEGENCEKETRERFVGSWTSDLTCDDGTSSTGINFEITSAVETHAIRIQSSQIYGNAEFLGFLDTLNKVDIPRFQGAGLNYYMGNIEELGTDRIKMTIIHEQTNSSCTFAMER